MSRYVINVLASQDLNGMADYFAVIEILRVVSGRRDFPSLFAESN